MERINLKRETNSKGIERPVAKRIKKYTGAYCNIKGWSIKRHQEADKFHNAAFIQQKKHISIKSEEI